MPSLISSVVSFSAPAFSCHIRLPCRISSIDGSLRTTAAELVARGLRVEELTSDEVARAQATPEPQGRSSRCQMLSLTRSPPNANGPCSGDGELRALAQAKTALFGVLWLADQLFDTRTLDANAVVFWARMHRCPSTLPAAFDRD